MPGSDSPTDSDASSGPVPRWFEEIKSGKSATSKQTDTSPGFSGDRLESWLKLRQACRSWGSACQASSGLTMDMRDPKTTAEDRAKMRKERGQFDSRANTLMITIRSLSQGFSDPSLFPRGKSDEWPVRASYITHYMRAPTLENVANRMKGIDSEIQSIGSERNDIDRRLSYNDPENKPTAPEHNKMKENERRCCSAK